MYGDPEFKYGVLSRNGCLQGRLDVASVGGLPRNHDSFFRRNLLFDEKKEHARAMPALPHHQRVLDLARRKGMLRASDLDAIEAPRVILTRLTTAGLLDRVGRGLYRLPSHAPANAKVRLVGAGMILRGVNGGAASNV